MSKKKVNPSNKLILSVSMAVTEKETNEVDNNDVRFKGGNDPEYLTSVIARDRPDILERMKAGEFKYVRAAAKVAISGNNQHQKKEVNVDNINNDQVEHPTGNSSAAGLRRLLKARNKGRHVFLRTLPQGDTSVVYAFPITLQSESVLWAYKADSIAYHLFTKEP
jgi:hypothetical protein